MNIRLSFLLPVVTLLILSACKKDDPDPAPAPPTGGGALPVLTTLNVTSITGTTANTGGTVSAEGGSAVTARGVAWGTAQNPTTANSATNDGSGEGDFASIITGLTPNTDYFVRAYATNGTGTAYGNQVSFTTMDGGGGADYLNPDLTYGSVTDQNGNAYATIVIGTQEWMAENLRTTTYANGDPIPNVTDNTQWQYLTTGAWSHFFNDNQYENPYGKLYNWYTVADPRNVCPTGWHVPTDAEYTLFTDYLGGQSVAGGKMKSTGTQYWTGPNNTDPTNTDAANESGFSGLPGGYRGSDGTIPISVGLIGFLGVNGYWWSSTGGNTTLAWNRSLSYDNGNVGRGSGSKKSGRSVRCLKD